MLQFEGDRDFAKAPAELWAKLNDARFLVRCIPGVEGVTTSEADRAVCTLRPGFAFVRGTLEVTLKVVEATPEKSLRLSVLSKGVGTSSDVEAVLTFEPRENGTHLHWRAEVKSLGGLLKAVPTGLVRGAAQKV